MIRALARTLRLSAFSAMLAYVLVLNVFLAGFAQAAAFEHAVNGGTEICVTDIDGNQIAGTDTAPNNAGDKSSLHHCQTCCLSAHSALPPVDFSRSAITRKNVVKPQPDGPIKDTNSTLPMSNDTFDSA